MIAWIQGNKRELLALLNGTIAYAIALYIFQWIEPTVRLPALDYALQFFEAYITISYALFVMWRILHIVSPTIDKDLDQGLFAQWWAATPDNQKMWASLILCIAASYCALFALFLVRLP